MKIINITSVILILTTVFFSESTLAKCQNKEHFICSPANPEDLLPIPGTSLIVISSMEDIGHLYLMDSKEHTTLLIFKQEIQ